MMNVLFINSGEPPQENARHVLKTYLPRMAERYKNLASLILPRPLLRSILSGFGVSEKRFPLGLGYLSATLKQEGHSVYLLDRFADPANWIQDLHRFDFVGIYASTPCYEDTLRVLARLEREDYGGPIALGGPHTSVFPRTIPPQVDYVVQGEAEYVINDLIDGVYPSGVTLRTQRIKDLDALPRPDYDLFLDEKRSYQLTMPFADQQPVFNMNTSRSCPHACSFCGVRDIWGRLWTAQSAARVVDDILYLKRKYDIAGVYFREDFFPASKKRVVNLCELLLRQEANILWACETRVDTASDERLIELMAASGCRGFYIGAESGSQRMLDHYKKGVTVEQIVDACSLARRYDISVVMSLIMAHPLETWRDRLATWKLVRRTRPDILYVNAYRDEYTRHGMVDLPTYAARPVVDVTFDNGTWRGQRDRQVNA